MNSWQRAMADFDALDPRGVGAGGDEQVGIAPRVERSLDLGQHLLDRHDLLARQIAAAVGKHLVADEQAGDARRLEGAHHLPHIVDAAEAGVGIDVDRHLDRGADARVVVGIVAHVGLAHVGLRQHAADRRHSRRRPAPRKPSASMMRAESAS